ncbi:type II toxin-antitoxin system RelE/ParE family toxin [Desulfovibrio sulfodismutans]|uniref:Type II toxin-antitoxin system RelE/ParE family toxin n=1 Tax=Desulfolutivibrio sulfodismutans TaxID=63561 RepID=A0A7K3NQT9_9BACT|nr:type II toxin-antitoxin system RelE/ParE family toxin [Desulfolutivibrio sulfodismutans]NDY58592.1 type II toxin-antitoxin system RelE/ParE family toxin [Desulfolutivibrio sulfodismutans]QLA14638.1 type II toxin-antitoxin system RelE/ParE family toxin [Desulfolutivibrio sulfodismutans DSM 3696]
MPRVELAWTPSALRGVQRAYRFLAEKDRDAAKAAAGTIRKQAALLQKFPVAGRLVDDLDPEHRELLIPFGVTGYVLVYEVSAERILVLAVRHQKKAGY